MEVRCTTRWAVALSAVAVFCAAPASADATDDAVVAALAKHNIVINDDNSVDVYFGPKAPAGNENNWVQTVNGKSWFVILRLYGPLQTWFDKTWKPGEIEEL